MSFVHKDGGTINKFGGLYRRGGQDVVPPDHAVECRNIAWDSAGAIAIRDGLALSTVRVQTGTSGAYDMHSVVVNYIPRTISLDVSGTVILDGTTVLFVFVSGFPTALAIQAYGNRIYLSPYIFLAPGSIPANALVYWYDGTTFAPAAGVAPGVAPVLAQVGAGVVTAGIHNVRVIFETATGFLTPPGPSATINSTGTNRIELTNIATGGPGTLYRRIIATRAGGTEYFFVPNGTVFDNVTTTHNIDFADTDLIVSADYLFDLLTAIPYCVQILEYHNRNVYLIQGPGFPKTRVYVSKINDPETISIVDGYIDLPNPEIEDVTGASGAVVNRDVLYISTRSGCFYVVDNGEEPANWQVLPLDDGMPIHARSVAQYKSSKSSGTSNDVTLIANEAGFWKFGGGFPEIPLSYKIDTWWRQQFKVEFDSVKVVVDNNNKIAYLLLPTTGQTPARFLMAMDFKDGLSPETVRWSEYTCPLLITGLCMRKRVGFDSKDIDVLFVCSTAEPFAHEFVVGALTDTQSSTPIDGRYFAGPVRMKEGWITTYTGIKYKTDGAGVITGGYLRPDDTVQNLSAFTSQANESREYRVGANVNNEKFMPGFRTTARVKVYRMDVHGKPMWQERPA